MNQHVDLIRGHVKQPSGFDDLQRLVEHGRRIDGDLPAHVPVRMLERLLLGRHEDILLLPRAERTAAGRENQTLGPVGPRALQALENGAVLAVHRQQRMPCFLRRLRHQLAAGDERLLVGQQHALAAPQTLHHGGKTDHADHGHEHVVRVACARNVKQYILAEHPLAYAPDILRNFLRLDGQRRNLRPEHAHLLKELFT